MKIVNALGKWFWGKRACAIFLLCATMAMALTAQTFKTLHSFAGYPTGGADPSAGLVQATNGDLYGTTQAGGAKYGASGNGSGTVFKMTPGGTLMTLYSFCTQSGCTDGANPSAGLVQATNGDLFGTTSGGGANGNGTIFRITPTGSLTTLYSFCSQSGCTDGAGPYGGLVQAANGDLYGTTQGGGSAASSSDGTVFKMTPGGALTTIYSFCSQSACTDGADPSAGLVQATNGDLYGTTVLGGGPCYSPVGCGTVFKITPSGTLTTLHRFCLDAQSSACTDGEEPWGGLVLGTDGEFYGTTYQGGVNPGFDGYDAGTVFKITQNGKLTTLYNFCSQSGCTDGQLPFAGLAQATDGNIYGTTEYGGINCAPNGCGTVFKITPSGMLTTLYSFCSQPVCADGSEPVAALVQDTNGDLYGTTGFPTNGDGTVFALSVGLGPFVKTRPAIGEVGSFVEILGSELTGATSVTFNGTAATFTVVSRTLIKATVPAGASTGKVHVVTPGGTLLGNVSFVVVP
jgi:uncharacterized repeat protein (TIGR03803 family)